MFNNARLWRIEDRLKQLEEAVCEHLWDYSERWYSWREEASCKRKCTKCGKEESLTQSHWISELCEKHGYKMIKLKKGDNDDQPRTTIITN